MIHRFIIIVAIHRTQGKETNQSLINNKTTANAIEYKRNHRYFKR